MANPNIISQEVINLLTTQSYQNESNAWIPNTHHFINSYPTSTNSNYSCYDANIKHFSAPIVHPVTRETISSYKKLARNPVTQDTWMTSLGKEFGNIAQGDLKTGEKGTNCVFVMTYNQIKTFLQISLSHMHASSLITGHKKKTRIAYTSQLKGALYSILASSPPEQQISPRTKFYGYGIVWEAPKEQNSLTLTLKVSTSATKTANFMCLPHTHTEHQDPLICSQHIVYYPPSLQLNM